MSVNHSLDVLGLSQHNIRWHQRPNQSIDRETHCLSASVYSADQLTITQVKNGVATCRMASDRANPFSEASWCDYLGAYTYKNKTSRTGDLECLNYIIDHCVMNLHASTLRCNGGIANQKTDACLQRQLHALCICSCTPLIFFSCSFLSPFPIFYSCRRILETSASISAPVISSWWPVILPASSSLRWHAL